MDDQSITSKLKKRKTLGSDSEDDEVLKKHKSDDSSEAFEREIDLGAQTSKKGSKELTEGTQNGKYGRSVGNGLSDSHSAGTDVELTSDDETPLNHQRPKKKKKINERRSRNNLQAGSSSESEDEEPLSPRSPPSAKKSYRRRRTISGNKTRDKTSTESESYKTDSESDEQPLKQNSSKDPALLDNSTRGKDDSDESRRKEEPENVKTALKNKIEHDSSSSENDEHTLKLEDSSSSDESKLTAKGKELLGSSSNSKKQVVNKASESSSDQCMDPGASQGRKKKEIPKKDNRVGKGNKQKSATSEESEDENKKNTKRIKSESITGSSDNSDAESKGEVKETVKLPSGPKGKELKKEKSLSESGSDSDDKVLAKTVEKKKTPSSSANNASQKRARSSSSSSSSSESAKKGKEQKKKLPDEDKRIINLKKYLKTAGIRVPSYADLWKDCRSNKARAQKMLSLLEQNGLKGRPTIEKCKKLRKKIETKKEVQELDLSNVMDCGGGRTRRSRLTKSEPQELPDEAQQTSAEIRKRLRVLADSDSDSD